jgi:hypothetical protein
MYSRSATIDTTKKYEISKSIHWWQTLKNSRVMHEPYITFSVIIYAIYIGFYLKYSGLRQNVSRDCIFLSETDGMGQLISNFSKNIYQNAIITNNIDIKLQTYLVVCSRYLW